MSYDLTQIDEVYNNLTSKIKTDLDNQYQLGRLTGSDYATVYAQLMGQCLQLAFQTPKLSEEVVLTQKQEDSIDKDIEVKDAQKDVYIRQKQGFDDKMKLDLTKIQMDAWSVMFSSGLLTQKPLIISGDGVSLMYADIENQLSIIPTPIINTPSGSVSTTYTGYIENYSNTLTYSITADKLTITDNGDGLFTYTTTDTADKDTIKVIASNGTSRRITISNIEWS